MSDDESVPDRLLRAGAELILAKGFGGASVREICAAAHTSSNMIHHYFGDKAGLLQAIVNRCDERVFAVPLRLLDPPVTSAADFRARFGLLFTTTLDACLDNRLPLLVALREQANLQALVAYQQRFVDFVRDAQTNGWARPQLDAEMLSGAVLDRVTNYVLYAPWQKQAFNIDVLGDIEFRQSWAAANLDFFLNGLLADHSD